MAKAGLTFQVSEFTLADLADLQAILDAQWVDPLAAIEGELQAAQGDSHRSLLAAAYEAAEAGPPIYGEPSGQAFYATTEGMAVFLWVALKKNHPSFTPEMAADLVRRLSEGEYSQIWRIAHGSKTIKTLERMLGLGTAKPAAREVTWGELIDEVCQSHPGWTYADVYGLTLSEWVNARRHGEPEEVGVPVHAMDSEALARMMAEQRAKFYGEQSEGGE